eukprot:COSAG01_NODE_6377_length_3682_cov_1.832779_3_plen_57_part_01
MLAQVRGPEHLASRISDPPPPPVRMLAEGASASSFYERLVHFSVVLNPLNCLASSGE